MVKEGFDIHFTEDGGYIKSRDEGRRIQFLEADGAYWLKMKVSPPDDLMDGIHRRQVFSRPGP